MRVIKILAIVVGLIVIVVVGGVAIVAKTFDPNAYKPELAAMVKEKTGRTLTIDGPLSLNVFPSLGVAMGKVALSEPGNAKVFGTLAEARVSLAVMPLLSQRVVVDRIVLKGLNANLIRARDGRMNIDDLMDRPATGAAGTPDAGKAPPGGKAGGNADGTAPFKLDIDGVDIQADSLGWRDERDGTQLRITGLKLKTGKIADNATGKLDLSGRVEGAKPKLNLAAAVSTAYRFNFVAGSVSLSNLSVKLEGDAPGAAGLKAALKGDIESDPGKGLLRLSDVELSATTTDGIDARLTVPKLSISSESAQSASINGTIKIKRAASSLNAKLALAELSARAADGKSGMMVSFPKLEVEFSGKRDDMKLEGKLTTPVSVNLNAKTIALSRLTGEFTALGAAIPQQSMRVSLDGQGAADWGKETATGNLTAKLDDSTVQTRFGVTGFASPAISFDTAIDRLNVDRYRAGQKPTGSTGGSGATGGAGKPAAESSLDLSALTNLNLNGQARIGQFIASGVKLDKLQANVRAAGGRLDVNPISAGLYGGTLAGSASAENKGNHFSLKQQLVAVNIGPLLRDLTDKDMLEGRGNVTLDLQTSGASTAALKRGLNGTGSLQMKDGAIKGINLAESFRKAKALLGSKSQEQAANKADKTDFTDLSASFVIRGGVARNDDLAAKSPFLRLGGAGTIDIGASQVDYLAKVAIVNTSGGQGAKDLNEMRGLTIPVRLSGPFDALKYRIDFGAVATEAVKQKVQETVKEKVQDKLQDRLKGLFKR